MYVGETKVPKILVLSPKGISGNAKIVSSQGFCTATGEEWQILPSSWIASKVHIIVVWWFKELYFLWLVIVT